MGTGKALTGMAVAAELRFAGTLAEWLSDVVRSTLSVFLLLAGRDRCRFADALLLNTRCIAHCVIPAAG
jgi:hypothetical protein